MLRRAASPPTLSSSHPMILDLEGGSYGVRRRPRYCTEAHCPQGQYEPPRPERLIRRRWGRRLGQRQFHPENRAVCAIALVDIDLTVMRLDDGAHDGKAHAHAMVLGRIEGVEDLLCGVLGYARAGVRNRNFREPAVSHRRHGHGLSDWVVSDVASNPFRI